MIDFLVPLCFRSSCQDGAAMQHELRKRGTSLATRPRDGASAPRQKAAHRSMPYGFTPATVLLAMLLHGGAALAAERTAAVFDFELIDTSLEGATNGPRADEQARLASVSERLRQRLTESGQFRLLDIAPVAAEARASNLQACGNCDARLAKKLGADIAITGTVQKVSNLILNMNIYVRDADSGRSLAAMSADFRSNTDESWSRAIDWLVRNRLLVSDALK